MVMRFMLLFGIVLYLCVSKVNAQEPLVLEQALFTLAAQTTPPPDTAAWQTVNLPDWWIKRLPSTSGQGWYRLSFPRPANHVEPLYAVYLPKLGLNAAVYVNGVAVGSGGSFEEPLTRHWNRPLLFVFPAQLLHDGQNRLDIRLRGHAYTQPYLFPPVIGEEALVRAAYERLVFRNITLNQTASLIILVIGIFMLSLWWQRRRDTAYGLFGVAAFVWSAQSVNLFIQQAPVSTAVWEIAINASFQVFSVLLLISMLSFVGGQLRGLRRVLWSMMLLSPLTLAFVPAAAFFKLTAFWHLCSVLATVVTLSVLVREAWLKRNPDARKLMLALSVVVVFATHDWLIHSHYPALQWLEPYLLNDGYLLQFAAPVLFFMIGMIMTSRFARVLNDYESLNHDLEARIQEKHQALASTYARMRELEREQAMQEERERIYGDLHDDVGAKLLSLVYRARNVETADLARAALQDLRDVVSHADAAHSSLAETLLAWEGESRQRLHNAGLQLLWQQPDPLVGNLDQPQMVNMGRILREAISNVIHHAQASTVTVQLQWEATQCQLMIQDNGCGIPAECVGRGLKSMRKRAALLGATLQVLALEPHGTQVVIRVPLTGSVAA